MSLDLQKSEEKYESLDLDRALKYSYYTINTLKINRELLHVQIPHYLIYKVSFSMLWKVILWYFYVASPFKQSLQYLEPSTAVAAVLW